MQVCNGPQYSASTFTQFAKEYGISQITSSPRYPQSNGAAERAVKTVKALLEKNPYLALPYLSFYSIRKWLQPSRTSNGSQTQNNHTSCPDTTFTKTTQNL